MLLRSYSGASIRRVIDPSHSCVPEHAHDWPVLSLFVIGSYLNETEAGETFVAGPSAVLYRAGARHRNTTAAVGFEQIEIEFDPSWLGSSPIPPLPVTLWVGGRVGAEARYLARSCEAEVSEARLRTALQRFFAGVSRQPPPVPARWIGAIGKRLGEDPTLRIADLAALVRRHPSWAGSAYRRATGEGFQETAARLRVERAARLLRETSQALSCIALDAGFCDQSHMNRTFGRVLGRSPAAVREERRDFRLNLPLPPAAIRSDTAAREILRRPGGWRTRARERAR
jgi:AraC-like DNA-binding protein